MLIELMIVITMINILVDLDNPIFWVIGQCSNHQTKERQGVFKIATWLVLQKQNNLRQ